MKKDKQPRLTETDLLKAVLEKFDYKAAAILHYGEFYFDANKKAS